MLTLKPSRLYWDSDVFLSYFGKTPDRFADVQSLLAEVQQSQDSLKIITSVITKAEVAYIAEETTQPERYPDVEATLDEFWANARLVELVEMHEAIATQARTLIRTARLNGWRRLGANDALHLATALWMQQHVEVTAFHTYNLRDYEKFRAVVPFPIEHPRPRQPRLL